MRIYLDVTWPVTELVELPDSEALAAELCDLRGTNLREDLVRMEGNDCLRIHGLFGLNNRVDDVDRYELASTNGDIRVRCHQVGKGNFISSHPFVDRRPGDDFRRNVVLVLESPHRDEYGRSVCHPIAAARGQTGQRIHKYLANVLRSSEEMTKLLASHAHVRVIISNPIQLQTSAYAIHGGVLRVERLRNAIWNALWNLESRDKYPFRDDFRRRLESYAPIAAINACTSDLGSQVTNFLRDWRTIPTYKCHHPARWGKETILGKV